MAFYFSTQPLCFHLCIFFYSLSLVREYCYSNLKEEKRIFIYIRRWQKVNCCRDQLVLICKLRLNLKGEAMCTIQAICSLPVILLMNYYNEEKIFYLLFYGTYQLFLVHRFSVAVCRLLTKLNNLIYPKTKYKKRNKRTFGLRLNGFSLLFTVIATFFIII